MKKPLCEKYKKLRCRLVQEIGCGRDFLIGIDGPCCAGKSTLARYLSWKLEVPAIGLDLFLIPDQGKIEYDIQGLSTLSWILSKRLKDKRVTIVEGLKLLEVLDKQPRRRPDYLIYMECTDCGGCGKLKDELQAYREHWKPRDFANEVLKWSLDDTSPSASQLQSPP